MESKETIKRQIEKILDELRLAENAERMKEGTGE